MELLKQPANLKNFKTMSTVVGTILLFLAIPITVFTVLQTREPTGQAAGATNKWIPFMRGADQFLTDITVNPNDSDDAFISVDVASPRRTKDAGLNWYIPGYDNINPDNGFPGFPGAFTSWSVLFSPHSTPSNQIILSGGSGGNIWRSSAGDTWTKTNANAVNLIDALASDPNNPNIFYAGTGTTHDFTWDFPKGPGSGSAQILKSTDSGSNWLPVYTNTVKEDAVIGYDPLTMIPAGRSIFSIEVKPESPNVVFAATEKGLYKSENANCTTSNCMTFTRVPVDTTDPTDLTSPTFFVSDTQIDPDNPEKMWVSLKTAWVNPTSNHGGVYFSSNGGSTWQKVNNTETNHNLPFNNAAFFGYDRLLLVKHNDSSRKLYVANGAEANSAAGLWVSNNLDATDAITSWTKLTRYPGETNSNIIDSWSGKRGLLSIAVAKNEPDRIWVSGHGGIIYKSDDKGLTWDYVAAKEKTITTTDFGTKTYWANNGLALEGLLWMSVDPHDSTRLYGGDIDHGLFVSVDGGESARLLWRPTYTDTGTGPSSLIVDPDPAFKDRMYVGLYQQVTDLPYKGGVAYSEDHGKSWTKIGGGIEPPVGANGLPVGNVLGLQLDLSSVPGKRVLIAVLDGVGIYRGRQDPNNNGNTKQWVWEPFGLNATNLAKCDFNDPIKGTDPSNCGPGFSELKTDPANPKRMYALGPGSETRAYAVNTATTGIYRCDDITVVSPCNWKLISNDTLTTSKPFDALVIDPLNSNIVYSLGTKGVYYTLNAQAATVSWQPLLHSDTRIKVGSDNAAGVAIVENGKSVLYVGCRSCGIVRSGGLDPVTLKRESFTNFNDVQFQDPAKHTHDLKKLKVRGVDYDPVTNRLFASTQGNGSFQLQLSAAAPTTKDYYVDCGPTNGDGSAGSPWNNLTSANSAPLNPGESLLLKRGCSWTGPLTAKWNGTSGAPITIGAYPISTSMDNLPSIRNTDASGEVVQITGSYQIIEYIDASSDKPATVAMDPALCPPGWPIDGNGKVQQPKGWRVGFKLAGPNGSIPASHDNIIRFSKAHESTMGIFLKAGTNNNKVLDNVLTNNTYVSQLTKPTWVSTDPQTGKETWSDASDDAGAMGIGLQGDNNEIARNTFGGNNGCTYDFPWDSNNRPLGGPDGISIEVYGAKRNNIHHNKTVNDYSFVEVGSDTKPTTDIIAEDNTLSYNLMTSDLNKSTFLNIHGSGIFGPTRGTKAFNNTVYLTGPGSSGVLCNGCNVGGPPLILELRNNILSVTSKGVYSDVLLGTNESNNIFYCTPLANASCWWVVQIAGGRSENIASTSKVIDPKFVSVATDFHLQSSSPGVNAGTTVSCPACSTDLDGVSVPQSTATDIGAFEFTLDAQPPIAPTGLTTTQVGYKKLNLSWTASTDNNPGTVTYEVYRNAVKLNIPPLTTTTFTDTGLNPATAYSYFVKAKDAVGNLSAASNTLPVTTKKLGDVNSDGTVNQVDLNILISKWKSGDESADFNNDGKVNIIDLSVLLTRWESLTGPSFTTPN